MNRTPTTRKSTVHLASAFALVLLLLATAQPTTAQSIPGCDVISQSNLIMSGASSEPITPISGTQVMTVKYEYRASDTAWSNNPIPINFYLSGEPAWANAVLSDRTQFIEMDTPGPTSVTGYVDVTVSVDQDAPAYQRAMFEIQAEAQEGTCVPATETAADLEITPGFLERWSAELEVHETTVAVGEVVLMDLHVYNNGNGAIEIQLDQDEPVQNGELALPAGFHVIGSQSQGDENQHTLTLEYEATHAGTEDVVVMIGGRSADDNTVELESKNVGFTIHTPEEGENIGELPPIPLLFVMVPLIAALHRLRKSGR